MQSKEQSVIAMRVGQWSLAASRRFGLTAMLMSLTLLFGSVAHAEPAAANQYLQIAKQDFSVLKVYYQLGRNYALAGNAAQAKNVFLQAQINAFKLTNDATALYQQNVDTLNRGLYRNLGYQQQAVSYSSLLLSQVQLMRARLGVLTQSPLSPSARTSVDISILQVTTTLAQTEQAMILAQR